LQVRAADIPAASNRHPVRCYSSVYWRKATIDRAGSRQARFI
jgi:hypothetical protein